MLARSWRRRALVVAIAAIATTLAAAVAAQTPGEWRYTIVTDQSLIPIDMQVNFPTISFSACRSAEDFANGRAFALQTLASSEPRCPSAGFVRTAASDGKGEALSFVYACDAGKTLSGLARGRIQQSRFEVNLESRYSPPVGGVEVVKQLMTGVRTGPCKVRPDSDLMKVE